MFGYRKWRTKRVLRTILQGGGPPRTDEEIHRALVHGLKGRALSRHPILERLIGGWDNGKSCVYGLPTLEDTRSLRHELLRESQQRSLAQRKPLELVPS